MDLDGASPGHSIRLAAIDITSRKQGEQRLRLSEQRFRSCFEMGLIGLAIISPDKVWLHFNQYLCDLFGYSRAELQQMTWDQLTHPEDLAANLIQFNRVLGGESDGYRLEKRYLRKDGAIIYAQIALHCLRRSDGSVDHLVMMVQDITARVAAEEKIIQASREWRRTFDTIPDLITILDADYRIIRTNRAMADALKVAPKEAMGLICYQHVHGTAAPPDICPHRQVMATGLGREAELYEERLGGWFQITSSPLHNEQNLVIGSVNVLHDITALKHHEQELQEGKALLRCLIDSVSDLIFIKDHNGVYLCSNKAYDEFLNLVTAAFVPCESEYGKILANQ